MDNEKNIENQSKTSESNHINNDEEIGMNEGVDKAYQLKSQLGEFRVSWLHLTIFVETREKKWINVCRMS